jgi:ResB-like family protein
VDNSAIQTSAPPIPPAPVPTAAEPAPRPKPARRRGPIMQAVYALASLKLTVVLMALAIGLVFIGTLAQVDDGIWTVVEKYFRSAFVWVPLRVLLAPFSSREFADKVPGGFPYPGGWLIGGVMLVNMTLAYFVRYNHFTWKRTGVYVLHSGLVVMMASEVITGLYAVEGQMAIDEGDSSNVVVQTRYYELAITSPSEDNPTKYLNEVVIPASMLRKAGATVHDDALPFDVRVGKYMKNSELRKLDAGESPPATEGAGRNYVAEERAEVSGTSKKQSNDMPSANLTFLTKDGQTIGTYLMSLHLNPQPVKVGDKTYKVALRFKQTYRPYSIELIHFSFDRYPGTQMARNFSSLVNVHDPERGDLNDVLIKMNNPLRHGGETFYQQSFDEKTEQTTVLQVVRNPGWLLPYIACVLVALGMMIHFGMHLITFLARRRAA